MKKFINEVTKDFIKKFIQRYPTVEGFNFTGKEGYDELFFNHHKNNCNHSWINTGMSIQGKKLMICFKCGVKK